jgi:hypothetical protein
MLSNIPVFDFSSTELKNDQKIESFAKDRIDGHEIHAVQRIPISFRESCPRSRRSNLSTLSEVLDDSIECCMVDIDSKFPQPVCDSSASPHSIINFHFQNQFLNFKLHWPSAWFTFLVGPMLGNQLSLPRD